MRLISVSLLYFFVAVSTFAGEFTVTPEKLTAEINIRKTKILEFKQLHDYGQEYGIRIWVAGGSAAGLAHYVKDDLENEFLKSRGMEPLYSEGRFGYNYFDIYRSTQDCDVIIDGNEEQAIELEKFIRDKFSHLQGSKEVFEVRLLDKPRGSGAGEKDALINNPDFLNQHTDSHSTGMVELTQPPISESAVRDLFDWNNQKNHKFIRDVVDNQLSYYFSNKHNTTKRFRDGINPPILSVLRYYTKLFQYGLKPRPEDEKILIKIIKAFDPKDSTWRESYVNKQINKNGIKMIRHAQDMEFAINTIERVGLKNKLLEFDAQGEEKVSLWVNKEPLRSFPLGVNIRPSRAVGKTAGDLGITVVAHETKDFLAYESITMSRRGVPNVFISRKDAEGETAVYGDGFYTKKGQEGAAGTGLTIRYTVEPNAVEGADFYIGTVDYIIFINRNALTVIDESIELGPVEYFKFLLEQDISHSDLGVWKKIGLKVQSKLMSLDEKQLDQIAEVILSHIDVFSSSLDKIGVLEQWMEIGSSHQYPEIIEKILSYSRGNFIPNWVVTDVLSRKEWSQISLGKKLVKDLMNSGLVGWREFCQYVLNQSYWRDQPIAREMLDLMVDKGAIDGDILQSVLSDEYWSKDEFGKELLQKIIKKGQADNALIANILSKQWWWKHQFVVDEFNRLLEDLKYHYSLCIGVFSQPFMWQSPEIENYLNKVLNKDAAGHVLKYVFSNEYWSKQEYAEKALRDAFEKKLVPLDTVIELASNDHWISKPIAIEIIGEIVETTPMMDDRMISHLKNVNPSINEQKYFEWMGKIIDRHDEASDMFALFENKDLWQYEQGGRLFKKMLGKIEKNDYSKVEKILKNGNWILSRYADDILQILYERYGLLIAAFFKETSWSKVEKAYEILDDLRGFMDTEYRPGTDGGMIALLIRDILSNPEWGSDERVAHLLLSVIKKYPECYMVPERVLGDKVWADSPYSIEFLRELIKRGNSDWKIFEKVLVHDYWYKKEGIMELLEEMILRSTEGPESQQINKLLNLDFYFNNPRLQQLAGEGEINFANIKKGLEKEAAQKKLDCSSGLQLEGGM